MAAKGNTNSANILKLIFQAVAIANVADNASSSPLTNLYVSLHTASPGASGNQTTNECAYTSYARVAVARTTGGFDISGQTINLHALTAFPQATGGSETATYFGIGTASSGAGILLYYGTVTPNIAISNTVTPELTAATTISES